MAYDNAHGLIAAAVIVQTLVLLMIVSRFVSHKMKSLKPHISDYLIVVAGLLSTALAIEQIYCMYLSLRQWHPSFSTLHWVAERINALARF
jgi:uncharacterized membrane protein